MDLRLLVLQGKPQGREIPIHISPFIIGRGPECHLRPNSDMVSRHHCALTIRGNEVRIRDLGSTNGTIVDGERLTGETTLNDGDIFQVGLLVFQIVIGPVAAATRPVVPAAAHPVGPPAAAAKEADADDVVQWLVSDSKNEVPSSGSGVYDGKTLFEPGPLENKAKPAPEKTDKSPSDAAIEKVRTPDDHLHRKPPEDKKPMEATGAAAHAAEDLIRRFVERRPHR